MLKAGVKRSACDQCRAKRVRCLRAENSTAPCARCDHIGARCVTGAPGHPGRPPKQRTVGGRPAPPNPAGVASSGGAGRRHRTSTFLREVNDVGANASKMLAQAAQWNPRGNLLDNSGLQPDFWGASGDCAILFGSPIAQSPAAPGKDTLALADIDQLSDQSQLRGLLSADDAIDAMLDMDRESSSSLLDIDLCPLLDPCETAVLPQNPLPQYISPATSLMRFREEIDQRIAAVDTYYSDPVKVVQGCKEGAGADQAENPTALLLTCSTKFIDIIQSLTPETGQTNTQSVDALSTEVVLLTLSSYLALMRLFDLLFYTIYEFMCDLPPASFKSIKVKSVLRIGGIATLQDMSLKTYATGIIDAIQGQMRTLERCMGIPTEHCLSGEATASITPGIFSRSDRTRLFWTVMEQEDVKSKRGGKLYVESIQASIKGSMRFLDD